VIESAASRESSIECYDRPSEIVYGVRVIHFLSLFNFTQGRNMLAEFPEGGTQNDQMFTQDLTCDCHNCHLSVRCVGQGF
jgi:hypothetical protein